ncbi:S-layer homology domain-containing protein [Paenibacillus sp. RC67]|uniref:S-layer homology domain-containing protein n=1 Tax=Paenibacillus sp. RC67 TaxID=3039392 RepID=UPI0024AD2583|nr:S-layer homology domain-containing protein [Paenibacillus sp. RC67]
MSVLLLTQLFAAVDVTDSWGNRTYAAESGSIETPASAEAESTVKPTAGFQDINESYAKKEIKALTDAGILSGYSDDRFAPEQPMTRAELAKIIVMSLGLKENADKASAFTDVDPDSWYRGFVGSLIQSGITQGTSDTTFSPEERVTREQLVVFFIRAMGLQTVADKLSAELPFTDRNAISAWARSSVLLASKISFVQGMDNGDGGIRFEPGTPAQRQALARLAYEFHKNRQQYIEAAQKLTTTEPKKEEVVQEEAPATCCFGGGGGGGGGKGNSGGSTSTPSLDIPGIINGNASISSSGTYGPKDGVGTANVTGTLVIDPGPNAEVVIQNVTAATLEVRSGSSNTIKLRNVHGELLIIKANQSQSVRVMTQEGTEIKRTEIRSKAIVEQEAGSFGAVMVTTDAANQNVELRGIYNEVTTAAEGASITFAPTAGGKESNVKSLSMQAGGKLVVQPKAAIEALSVSKTGSSIELDGLGKITSITFNAEAQNVKLNVLSELVIEKLVLENVKIALKGNVKAFSNMILELKGDNAFLDADPAIVTALKNKLIDVVQKAIDSIGEVKQYSAELEEKIATVDSTLKTAFKLGAKESEIANLSKFRTAQAALTDLALAKASELLQIEFKQGDQLDRVTQNITLPKNGFASTTVSWDTNDSAHVTKEGVVTRPSAGSADVVVKLTAVISRNNKTVAKSFTITIKALPASGTEPTNVPTVSTSVYTDTAWIMVWTEDNANLTLTDERAQLIGKTMANSYGYAIIPLRRELAANEQLQLVAQGSGKLASTPVNIAVKAAAAPSLITAMPVIVDNIYEDTSSITLEIFEPSVVVLQDEKGLVLDAAFVEGNMPGRRTYEQFDLDTKLVSGQRLTLSARGNGKKYSGTIQRTVKEVNGKTAPPVPLESLYEPNSILQIKTERDAEVFFMDETIILRSSGVIYTDDTSSVIEYNIESLIAGKKINIKAKSPGKAESDEVELTVLQQPTVKSKAPIVYKESPNGVIGGVITEKAATIYIRDSKNKLVYERSPDSILWYDDPYQFKYEYSNYDPSADVEIYTVTAKEFGKAESESIKVNVHKKSNVVGGGGSGNSGGSGGIPAENESKKPELISAKLYPDGGTIEVVSTVVDRTLYLKTGWGELIATAKVDAGQTKVQFSYPGWSSILYPGVVVYITSEETNKSISPAVGVEIRSNKPPEAPLQSVSISFNGFDLFISGRTTIGSTLSIKRASDGKTLFGPVLAYSSDFYYWLSKASIVELRAGDLLEVSAKNTYGIEKAMYVAVPDIAKTTNVELKANVFNNGLFIEGQSKGIPMDMVIVDDQGHIWDQSSYNDKIQLHLGKTRNLAKQIAIYVQESDKLFSDPIYAKVDSVQDQRALLGIEEQVNEPFKGIKGFSIPYSTIVVRNMTGAIVAQYNLEENRDFNITEFDRPLVVGEELYITTNHYGMKESTPISVTVREKEITEKPTVNSSVYDESVEVSVTTSKYSKIILVDYQDYLVGTSYSSTWRDETYVPVSGKMTENTKLKVYAMAPNQLLSLANNVPILSAPKTNKPTVQSAVYDVDNSFRLSVAAEYDSDLTLKKEDGTKVGTGHVYTSNSGYIDFYSNITLIAGETLLLTAKLKGMKESDPWKIIVQARPFTKTPTVNDVVYSESYVITGSTEPAADVYLKNETGSIVGSTHSSSYDGTFTMYLYLYSPFGVGETLNLSAKVINKKESLPLPIVVQQSPKTLQPTVTNTVYTMSNFILGRSEPSAEVVVKTASGQLYGYSNTADSKGDYSIYKFISLNLNPSDTLFVTAKVRGKSVSDPTKIMLLASPKTSKPIVTGAVYENGFIVSGTAENDSEISVKQMDGTLINKFNTSYYNSSFFAKYIASFSLGSQVQITAKAYEKAESDPVLVTVQSVSGKTPTPTVTGSVYQGYSNVYVQTEPYAKVTTRSSSSFVEDNTYDYSGLFPSIWRFPNRQIGEELTITAEAIGRKESDPVRIIVKSNP